MIKTYIKTIKTDIATIKTDIKNNIFKQDIIDPECCLLNKRKGTLGSVFYEKDWNNNHIVKHFENEDNFAREIILHQYLSNKKITTDFDIDFKNKTINYIIDNKISLYNYLKTCNDYGTLQKMNSSVRQGMLRVLSNELFTFVNNFKKYNFVHGNLHIGNIFINPKTFKLYIIDFTHARLIPLTKTSLDGKVPRRTEESVENEDLYSLYKSLNEYFTEKADHKSILYLESLISNYVKGTIIS